jgi:hypothetical protein
MVRGAGGFRKVELRKVVITIPLMTTSWSIFWIYFGWVLEFLIVPPFVYVTALLVGASFATVWTARNTVMTHNRREYIALAGQFIFAPLLLEISIAGAAPWPNQPRTWAVRTASIIAWSCVLYGLAWIYKFRNGRALPIITFLWCQWIMAATWSVAGTSLSGDWP